MENENLIHVKLEKLESIEDKREVLNTELKVLNLIKEIENYRSLRKKEFEKKTELLKLIRKLNANFNKIKKFMPKINYLENKHNVKKEILEDSSGKRTSIEMQLEDIQNRLRSLHTKF